MQCLFSGANATWTLTSGKTNHKPLHIICCTSLFYPTKWYLRYKEALGGSVKLKKGQSEVSVFILLFNRQIAFASLPWNPNPFAKRAFRSFSRRRASEDLRESKHLEKSNLRPVLALSFDPSSPGYSSFFSWCRSVFNYPAVNHRTVKDKKLFLYDVSAGFHSRDVRDFLFTFSKGVNTSPPELDIQHH